MGSNMARAKIIANFGLPLKQLLQLFLKYIFKNQLTKITPNLNVFLQNVKNYSKMQLNRLI